MISDRIHYRISSLCWFDSCSKRFSLNAQTWHHTSHLIIKIYVPSDWTKFRQTLTGLISNNQFGPRMDSFFNWNEVDSNDNSSKSESNSRNTLANQHSSKRINGHLMLTVIGRQIRLSIWNSQPGYKWWFETKRWIIFLSKSFGIAFRTVHLKPILNIFKWWILFTSNFGCEKKVETSCIHLILVAITWWKLSFHTFFSYNLSYYLPILLFISLSGKIY